MGKVVAVRFGGTVKSFTDKKGVPGIMFGGEIVASSTGRYPGKKTFYAQEVYCSRMGAFKDFLSDKQEGKLLLIEAESDPTAEKVLIKDFSDNTYYEADGELRLDKQSGKQNEQDLAAAKALMPVLFPNGLPQGGGLDSYNGVKTIIDAIPKESPLREVAVPALRKLIWPGKTYYLGSIHNAKYASNGLFTIGTPITLNGESVWASAAFQKKPKDENFGTNAAAEITAAGGKDIFLEAGELRTKYDPKKGKTYYNLYVNAYKVIS